ncbi:hypothetical protein A2239_02195 [Candidatus Uhrbacteria bacterium RIFOXYA2_FULL_40_9]|nr:MAG: hypothetical protein A2239_02195 [Candidatus Uhrbacteria bacterium RIFOXYA2_FULL_40_9]OGL97004.1 MAG: hypothetical protein A2332_04000 [Candidatus Uhrbacteria bacterium RIFOXYB2_FULL_41_18]HBK34758.1 hypothetical protein [Candidatus Uhrbacteria bacterium]HCB55966.1 hypothetical protein [Candidatus Uhrbacteria bacterium]
MKTFLSGPLSGTARDLIRRAGYGEIRGHGGEQLSYARRFSQDHYPRFHAYIEDRDGGIQINLHVDQKKASYEGTTAHSGEYEGPLVEQEMERIVTLIQSFGKPVSPPASTPPSDKKTKGFWS